MDQKEEPGRKMGQDHVTGAHFLADFDSLPHRAVPLFLGIIL
jgi:hypothetical protein